MLAQSFRSASDLGISEPQKDALIKTLVLLETGQIRYEPHDDLADLGSRGFSGHFNMHSWQRVHDCGTVACLGGTAEIVGNVKFASFPGGERPDALHDLFEPAMIDCREWKDISTEQAARALRSYLSTGYAKWVEAVA